MSTPGPRRYAVASIMCDLPECGMLASGIYYDADGSMVRRCTLHIPQAPATGSDSDEDSCSA